MSQTAVSRIWRAFGLKPHQVESFKLSPDPQFIAKVRDIVGLYLNPPDAAVVLCVDEKSQIQALDRSAPILPLMAGVPERHPHDYVRNGTTNLYAALDVASGQVIAEMTPRHRAEEFRRFLNLIDSAVPEHLEVHVVLDNSSTHKTPSIQRWLVRHPRFHVHFTPTYSSWLNLVERWFAELTTKWIKRSAHRSVRELNASIRTWITNWITNWNDEPKPYVWPKTADERSSTASPATANESTTQVTSSRRPGLAALALGLDGVLGVARRLQAGPEDPEAGARGGDQERRSGERSSQAAAGSRRGGAERARDISASATCISFPARPWWYASATTPTRRWSSRTPVSSVSAPITRLAYPLRETNARRLPGQQPRRET